VSRTKLEVKLAVWSALTFGSLLTSFNCSRPVRDALVLDGDPNRLPWLFTANFAVFIAIAPLWGAVVRTSPRRVVPLSFHLFAAMSMVFFVLLRQNVAPHVINYVFYVWAAVLNQFVVSVFWSLLADVLGPGAARRLYGPISAGGTIGAVGGPLLTKLLLADIGVAGVLVMTALFLELAVVGTWQIQRIATSLPLAEEHDAQPIAQGALNGLRDVVRSPYLLAIGGLVFCTATAATFVYLAQAEIVKVALPDRVARTDYFATLDTVQQSATFVVQLVFAAPLLRWLGPGIVMAVLPVVQCAGILGLAASPTLAVMFAVQATGRTVAFGLLRPARELLFTVVSRDEKYRAKNVLDTLVYRLGDFSSAWARYGLVAIAAGGLALTLTMIPLTLVWIALAIGLGVAFRKRVSLSKEPIS
jgi:AAA family ATP:ADP antiporter